MLDVELCADNVWGDEAAWTGLAEKAVQSAASLTAHGHLRAAVSLLLTDDTQVQQLNRQWRDKDQPTNVLSFPMLGAEALVLASAATSATASVGGDGPQTEILLGDIALAHETCMAEAAEKGITLQQHVTHLIIHGMLHLLGYDHIVDEEAEAMEALEIKALASLGLPNPYVTDEHQQQRGRNASLNARG